MQINNGYKRGRGPIEPDIQRKGYQHSVKELGRATIFSDQVGNFGQDDIVFLILKSVHRFKKVANLGVDNRPRTAGTSKVVHRRLNIFR